MKCSRERRSSLGGSSDNTAGALTGRKKRGEKKIPPLFIALYLAVSAVLILTVCSRSSALYGFNLWDDANSYFTMGKSIFRGKVPYRDLFDQKGILLYFIYGLASLISYRDFTGVFIMESLCAAAAAAGIYAILCMYLRRTTALILTPLSLAVMYSSVSFYWGGSAEEFNMPFIIWGIYILLRTLRRGIGRAGIFVCGVLAGCVFNIKFTSLGFFIAQAFIIMLCRASGKRARSGAARLGAFVSAGLLYLLGMAAATVPFVLYFAAQNAVYEWLYVYVYLNVFVYSEKMEFTARLYRMAKVIYWQLLKNIPVSALIAAAYIHGAYVFAVRRDGEQRKTYAAMLLALISACFFIYIGGVELVYYFYPVTAFSVLGFVLPGRVAELIKLKLRIKKSAPYLLCAVSFAAAFAAAILLSPNPGEMKAVGRDHWLYSFRDVIESSGIEDPGLINISCFDQGLYTVTGIVPECRYYQTQTIHLDDIEDVQKEFIKSDICDFVLTRDVGLDHSHDMYDLIAEREGILGGTPHVYYLYRRKGT